MLYVAQMQARRPLRMQLLRSPSGIVSVRILGKLGLKQQPLKTSRHTCPQSSVKSWMLSLFERDKRDNGQLDGSSLLAVGSRAVREVVCVVECHGPLVLRVLRLKICVTVVSLGL